jgi:hypothetical protein
MTWYATIIRGIVDARGRASQAKRPKVTGDAIVEGRR